MKPKSIVIIGGVAGGATAAARLRRLDESAEIIVLERGPQVSFANCGLPYHISGEIEARSDLVLQTPQSLARRMRLDVRVRHEALSIDRQAKTVRVRDLEAGRDFVLGYDSLLLSPGASPLRPPIPGIELPGVFTLRTLQDMDAIKKRVEARPGGRALILGGGFIGIEMAEALSTRGWSVQIVELGTQILGPADPEMAALLGRSLRENGVELRLKTALKALSDDGQGRLLADFGGAGEAFDLVLLSIGVRPETRLAREAGLELGPRGGIAVDAQMRSSDSSIFAVGDAVEVTDATGRQALLALAGPANRQGRIAADNIAGIPSLYGSALGTAILRAFGSAFAMTGATEKALKAAGRPHEKIYIHPNQHAAYYPGARSLSLKLLFDPRDGRVLGAQAFGGEGVDKRIDVLATAIHGGMTVHDLEELELAYAPPFGSAKDAVNFAGYAASEVLDGRVRIFHSGEAAAPGPDQALLDVRTDSEFAQGSIDGALHIPLDELRARLNELPKGKELLVFCRVGLRGYLACRILSQSGFRCKNLSGGMLIWEAWKEAA